MTKRRSITAILLLIVTILSLNMLTACKKRKFLPKVQGSQVMTIDNQDINGRVTSVYDNFKDFNSSEFANMNLNNFDFAANKSFYTREFFRTRNLVVVKFNDQANAKLLISNIDVKGNEYNVGITRIENTGAKNKKIQSYGLFLEVPAKYNINNAIVNIKFNQEKIFESLDDAARSNITSENPLEVAVIDNTHDMQHYIRESDKKTATMLAKYDEAFFKDKVLCIADFERFDKSVVSVDIRDNILAIDVYNTTHYSKDTDRMGRMVKFIPVERGTMITSVKLTSYWECDFDRALAPEVYSIDYKANYSEKTE